MSTRADHPEGTHRYATDSEKGLDLCPMCGYPTDDVAGGPCSNCWDEAYEEASKNPDS